MKNTALVNTRAQNLVVTHWSASSLQSTIITDLTTPPRACLLLLFTILSVISHPCPHLKLALQQHLVQLVASSPSAPSLCGCFSTQSAMSAILPFGSRLASTTSISTSNTNTAVTLLPSLQPAQLHNWYFLCSDCDNKALKVKMSLLGYSLDPRSQVQHSPANPQPLAFAYTHSSHRSSFTDIIPFSNTGKTEKRDKYQEVPSSFSHGFLHSDMPPFCPKVPCPDSLQTASVNSTCTATESIFPCTIYFGFPNTHFKPISPFSTLAPKARVWRILLWAGCICSAVRMDQCGRKMLFWNEW